MSILARLSEARGKRRRYLDTKREIAALPRDVALDLDIFPEDAAQIARRAVYG